MNTWLDHWDRRYTDRVRVFVLIGEYAGILQSMGALTAHENMGSHHGTLRQSDTDGEI
jgi:hypothetical protein